MMIALIFLFSSILLSTYGQTVVITPTWTTNMSAINYFTSLLQKTQRDMIFYHWSPYGQGLRWGYQGFVDKNEMDAFVANSVGMVSGGGMYLAADNGSSSSYGTFCTIFKIKAGTPLYDYGAVQNTWQRSISDDEKANLGKIVPFIHNYRTSPSWWVTHSYLNTQQVSAGILSGQQNQEYPYTSFFWPALTDIASNLIDQKMKSAYGYFRSFITLFEYYDGIGLTRAIKVNPSNPWATFEPEHFEQFKAARDSLLDTVYKDKIVFGISNNRVFGRGPQASWVDLQINKLIPQWWAKVAKTDVSQAKFRNEGIRAGGSDAGNRFLVTQIEYNAMKLNPYIEVDAQPSGNNYEVAYFYPDVFHYKKLVQIGRISSALDTQISAYTPDQLKSNTAVRQKLNQAIITELMKDLFNRNYGQLVLYTQNIQFLIDMISIHPFGDYNGRVCRLYYEMAHLDAGAEPPRYYVSDFDTLFKSDRLTTFLTASTTLTMGLQIQLLKEFTASLIIRRNPYYFDVSGWKNLTQSFYLLGLKSQYSYQNQDWDLIRDRKFTQLLNKMIGPNWG